MGCKICKSIEVNPIIEPVPVVTHEPDDDLTIDAQSDVNIEVLHSHVFNRSFIHQRQQAIDNQNYRSTIESWRPKTLLQLIESIKALSTGQSLLDCYWIIFYWIACNIEYDTVSYFTPNYANQSAANVFRTRKGIYAGYANLYKYICDQLNIRCERISGYSKGYGFDQRADDLTEIDHAWNAIEIDQYWYLIDSTWGAGQLTDHDTFKRQLNAYYFCARPNEMIYHHLPENNQWQFLREPITKVQFMQMPKIHPIYFEFNLELLSPRHQVHLDLLPNKSYALVLLRAPANVHLLADLQLHGQKIEGAQRIQFDKEKQYFRCYFASNRVGQHKATIYAKRNETSTGKYQAAIEFTLDVNQMPKNPVSYPETWDDYFDLNLKIISPKNTHLIRVCNEGYTEILVQTPKDVELLGRLINIDGKEIEGGYQVFYDRSKELWRCRFAPNRDGIFHAEILARRKSDSGSYKSAVSFTIEAKFIPTPPLSFPETRQLFHDLNLKIEAPRNRADTIWPESASFTEIRLSAPDDVTISCRIEYNGVEDKDCALAQFDHKKQQWQCLFAPQRTGLHKLIVYARRESTVDCVVQFNLQVKKLRKAMKFPTIYTTFETNKCRIYEPLSGVLKRDAIAPIHCSIPGAKAVDLQVDSKWMKIKGYKNPILDTKVRVGSTDVTIYAKYNSNPDYDGLIRYSVE